MSDDLEGAIRRLSEQVGALQTEVRALDRRPALPPSPPSEPESLEERRARVHAKAQEALEAMDDLEEPA